MIKKLLVVAVVTLAITKAFAASDSKEPCFSAVEIYSLVLKEYGKKTEVDEIVKQVQKKNSMVTEWEISQVIFHVRTMLNQGWSNEKILGYAEGICQAAPAVDIPKRETKTASMQFKGT